MCEPTTLALASLAISSVGAVAQYQAQSQSAKAQARSIETERAMQQNDLARQRDQQHEAAAAQMNEAARRAQREMALQDVIAGEYGGGNTADRASAVATVQNSEQLATLADNAQTVAQEGSFASMAVNSRANSRLAGIQRPSVLGTALKIGAAGLDAYSTISKNPTTKKG